MAPAIESFNTLLKAQVSRQTTTTTIDPYHNNNNITTHSIYKKRAGLDGGYMGSAAVIKSCDHMMTMMTKKDLFIYI
jgi:hypothetical protein